MREEGYIDTELFEYLDAIPVDGTWIRPYTSVQITVEGAAGCEAETSATTWAPTTSPQFIREEVKRIDPVLFTDNKIDRGGLRIYTSLNYNMEARRGTRWSPPSTAPRTPRSRWWPWTTRA